MASAVYYAFSTGASMPIVIYYIPIFFQAILSISPINSGLRTIALILSLVVASILAGQVTHRTGYYVPQMLIGSVLMSVGAGLLTTWGEKGVNLTRGMWIGYQVVYGLGLGMGMQQTNIAIQTVMQRPDVSIGVSLVSFSQTLGGSVFIAVAQNIFADRFRRGLEGIEGVDVEALVHVGATELRSKVRNDVLPEVLEVYARALGKTFVVATAISCVGIIGALTMEWRSIKKGEGQGEKPKAPVSSEKSDAVEEKVETKV